MKLDVLMLHEGRDDVTLTSYLLEEPFGARADTPRPAVLICPGGGYISHSEREGEPVALRFAAMGFHAFVLRYSINPGDWEALENGDPPRLRPESVHPAPMQDIALALARIAQRATEWGVDVQRIALCGFSAGSHNCAMYATSLEAPEIVGVLDGGVAVRPAAVILAYGPSDYLLRAGEAVDQTRAMLHRAGNVALLGTPDPTDEQRRGVSPALRVTETTPPCFLWTTAGDSLVPPRQVLAMGSALAEAGIPFELHVFERGDHGLSLADEATAEAQTQVLPDVAVWMNLAQTWLRLRLEGPLPARMPREQAIAAIGEA